jgi:hypothetical protein
MGTNYYGRQISKIEEVNAKEERIFSELRSYTRSMSAELDGVISEYFEIKRNEIQDVHIGKASGGWSFLFNHNNWEYFTDKESMLKWLETVEIRNEYGVVFTKDEFLKEISTHKDGDYARNAKTVNPQWYVERDGLTFSSSTNFC